MAVVKATPEISTLQLRPGQQALGSFVDIDLPLGVEGEHWQTAAEHGALSDLAGDLFWHMYDRQPASKAEAPPERVVNDSLLQWAQEGPQWQQMRDSTVGNMAAAIGSSQLMWNLLATDDAFDEALRMQELAEQARQAAAQAQQAAQNFSAAGMAPEADAYADQAGQYNAQAAELLQQAQEAIGKLEGDVVARASLAAAAKKAGEEAQEIAAVMAGYGLGPGDATRTDGSQARKLLEDLSEKARLIAKIAGRVRGIALSVNREQVKYGPVVTRVGMTKDLQKAMPSELALLRPDVPDWLRAQQVAKWLESGLLGWTPAGDKDKQGPFVAAVDISPSMWGEREILCKGVALGLAQAARAEGRDYILYTFASSAEAVKVATSKDSWRDHLAWAEYSARGGTDFDMAIGEALHWLDTLGTPDSADLMFLSDGEGHVGNAAAVAWKTYADEYGCRLLYVPIAPEVHARERYNLPQYCDAVIPVEADALLGDTAGTAGELARKVARWW